MEFLSQHLSSPSESLQKMQRALPLTSLNMSITSLRGCIRSEQGADLIRVHWANIVTRATLSSLSLLVLFQSIYEISDMLEYLIWYRILQKGVLLYLFSLLTWDVMQDAPKYPKRHWEITPTLWGPCGRWINWVDIVNHHTLNQLS